MSIPQIAAFPKGDDLWRVDWFGGIAFPDRLIRRTQPSVFVHLSRVIDPTVLADPTAPMTASSTLPWQKQFKCWVSVGSAMLLRIGDLWSNQYLVASPDHDVEIFESLTIVRSTAQLVKVGHSDDQGNFLLPVGEHPWHMANTHSYCVRVEVGERRSLIVPCMELARFYFGSSSPLLAALFLPPFDATKLYSAVRTTDFLDEDVELDLAAGVPEASGPDIARIAISKPAANAAAMIGVSLMQAQSQGAMDVYPKCVFPFEGATTIKASGRWLSLGGQPRMTFLVYSLRSCSHPFPFRTLKVQTTGPKRRAWRPSVPNIGRGGTASYASAPDAKDQTLRERDASGSLRPGTRRQMVRDVKFPDLTNKRVWSELQLAVHSEARVGVRGATAVANLAVGESGSVQRVRSITLVEAFSQPNGPPAFLLPAIERFARLKRLNVTLLTASIEDGWTLPIPYSVSVDGEIPAESFIGDGGATRLWRVAAFLVNGGRREARIVVKESDVDAPYVERAPDEVSVHALLMRAFGLPVEAF